MTSGAADAAVNRSLFWRWMVVGAVALVAGFALKLPCLTGSWDGRQYSTTCYSDVQALFEARDLAQDPPAVPYVEEFNEYPVGTGAVMYAIGRQTASVHVYTYSAYLVLVLWGLTAVAATAATAPRSAWRFAAAPSLVLLGFVSWDLIAVGLAAVGLWFASQAGGRRYLWAGIAVGLGAAVKLYPVFLLPALVLVPWPFPRPAAWRADDAKSAGGDIRGRVVPMIAGAFGAWLVVNVPVLAAAPAGWLETWRFHAERIADFDTVWFWLARTVPVISNDATLRATADWIVRIGVVAACCGFVYLAMRAVRRSVVSVDRARAAAALGTVVVFLLLSKVYSPQYGLWILPLFALAVVPRCWWIAYEGIVVVLVLARYRWFLTAPDLASNGWTVVFAATVLVRWLLLAGICAWIVKLFTRGERAPRPALGGKDADAAARKSSGTEILAVDA